MLTSTVAAVSTPPGKGGIAVIRISGPDTADVLDRCFRAASGKKTADRPVRGSCFGTILGHDGRPVDTGLAVFFRGPSSYTGEDLAELSCHGGTAVTAAVLTAVYAAGAEPAGPGEFTRRAFAAGKLTLSEAEAVGLLIDADTDGKRRLAASAAAGALSAEIGRLGDELSSVLSALWAAIDYPEEDVGEEGLSRLSEVTGDVTRRTESLMATYRTGAAVAQGIPTVICGTPNVGKSSLYNALCGRDLAIVTDVPGTTRDVLTQTVDCGGVTLLLSDTAGLRETSDPVERIGIGRAEDRLRDASLILFAVSAETGVTAEDLAELETVRKLAPDAVILGLINKTDANNVPEGAEETLAPFCRLVLTVSAKTGEGMEHLRASVAALWNADLLDRPGAAVVFDERQLASLQRADEILRELSARISEGAPADVLGVLCEAALAELRRTDGRNVSEEIINGIFSRFCVGK